MWFVRVVESDRSNHSADRGGGGGGAATAPFTAVVNGQAWAATTATFTATVSNNVLTLAGTDATGWTLGITIPIPLTDQGRWTTGSVPLSTGANAVLTSPTPQTWSATWLDGGSGDIRITGVATNSITGTFSFTMVPSAGGASGNRTVSQGMFSVTF
jgi:hypothetical protein